MRLQRQTVFLVLCVDGSYVSAAEQEVYDELDIHVDTGELLTICLSSDRGSAVVGRR